MTDPWPTSWDDEPWPLEDPSPGPALRPTSWSDSLTPEQVPHPADLADEAYAYAEEHGCSLERALAELQHLRGRSALAGAQLQARAAGVTYHYAVSPSGAIAPGPAWHRRMDQALADTIRRQHAAREAELRRRAEEARDAFEEAARRVADVFARVDWSELADQIQRLASAFDDPGMAGAAERRAAIRFCPRHGALAKGGFCRRCER